MQKIGLKKDTLSNGNKVSKIWHTVRVIPTVGTISEVAAGFILKNNSLSYCKDSKYL